MGFVFAQLTFLYGHASPIHNRMHRSVFITDMLAQSTARTTWAACCWSPNSSALFLLVRIISGVCHMCCACRFHRKDHMGYVLPAETLTLLEGFEEEAEAMARSAQQHKLQQLLLPRHPAHQQQQPQHGEQNQQQQSQQQRDAENSGSASSTSSSTSLSERVNREKMVRMGLRFAFGVWTVGIDGEDTTPLCF
eukprot:375155-Pelagomonas_calceolata.AAC.2